MAAAPPPVAPPPRPPPPVPAPILGQFTQQDYYNFLKLGKALKRTAEGLTEFAKDVVNSFHTSLLSQHGNAVCTRRGIQKRITKRSNNWTINCLCAVCGPWMRSIAAEQATRQICWENTSVDDWPVDAWQLAKPFMSTGKTTSCNTPQDTDPAGILQVMINCMQFGHRLDIQKVKVVLTKPGHSPVTRLAWCPTGDTLVTGSAADASILVWEVSREMCTALRRFGCIGNSVLSWSPDGSNLLAASPAAEFRVWECRRWTTEKWSNLSGRVKCAQWSPDGSMLLFATVNEPIIYSLSFQHSGNFNVPGTGGSKVAVQCADLSETFVGDSSVGGNIQAMAWDPTGERLAVQFTASEMIALFQTRMQPVLEIIPCGFVRGNTGDTPSLISFQPSFVHGALLTVVWTRGTVSYVPLYFVPAKAILKSALYLQRSGNVPAPVLLQPTTLFSQD